MDTTKKFLFVNPDATAAEYDTARMFPISSLQGIQEINATSVALAFSDPGQADDTFVDITVTSGQGKAYIKELVEAINYSKQSVINLADDSDDTSFSTAAVFTTPPAIALGSA